MLDDIFHKVPPPLLVSAGHLPVPPGELQAADLQQCVRVPVVGRGDWLVSGSVFHALHPRQPPLQTLQSQGNLQRGQHQAEHTQTGY